MSLPWGSEMIRVFRHLRHLRRLVRPLALITVLLLASSTKAADPMATAKARASLRLATACEDSSPVAVAKAKSLAALSLAASSSCGGRCREDYLAALAECRHTGKPLLLFVGGCGGLAKDLPVDWLHVRTDDYAGDASPRLLVMIRGNGLPETPDPNVVYVRHHVAAAVTPAGIMAIVESSMKPSQPVVTRLELPACKTCK
jgi:hypothetical protein